MTPNDSTATPHFRLPHLIGALLLAVMFLALGSLGHAQTYVRTASPASPSFTIPAYDLNLGPLTKITATIQTDVTRTYTVENVSTDTVGVVTFNAPTSTQGTTLKGPTGAVLASTSMIVPPTTFTCPPLVTMTASDSYTYFAFPISTTITDVRPYTLRREVPFTVEFPSSYFTNYVSGAVNTVQSTDLPTIITITYN